MVSKKEEMSLLECLSWCSVRKLPEEWDKKNVYIKAIGKVKKADGTISYVAIQKDKNGKDKMVKDFGTISAIREVAEIYPYLYLDAMYLPTFRGQKKEDRISMLSNLYKDRDFSQMSLKELDREVLNYAIQMHLMAEKNKSHYSAPTPEIEEEPIQEEDI